MKYADANVFIYAAMDSGEKGRMAKEFFVREFSAGRKVASSILSFDEITWVVKKKVGLMPALKIARDLMNDVRLHWVSATPEVVKVALELMEVYDLDPRDSIHVASFKMIQSEQFVSEDKELDRVPFLKRLELFSR